MRRLNDGKMMTATYAQTHTYEHILPYRKEDDKDNDFVKTNGDEHDDVNEPDTETELDEDMSENDLIESDDTNVELATDDREALEAEALDLAQVEHADDTSWDSDSPLMRSNASESEHDGNGNAELAETDSHDTASMNDDDVMEGVSDMMREIENAARARPTHKYKLRQRPKGRSKQELKEKLKTRGPVGPVQAKDGKVRGSAPHPSSRAARTPQYEVDYVIDVARMGKKKNGGLVFRVLWDTGETTWEKKEMLEGGAERALRDFLLALLRKQVAVFRRGELERMLRECASLNDDDFGSGVETSDEEEKESVFSNEGDRRRKKRMKECYGVLKAVVRKKVAPGETIPNTVRQAKAHPKWDEFASDMKLEFDNFKKKGVWRLVPRPANVNVVSVRWVFDIKVKNGVVVRYKARLVCRGFNQKEGEDYNASELYAPTMKTKTCC